MKHFPIFLDTQNRQIALSGGGDAALAKLRLLLKTEAELHVYAPNAVSEIHKWATSGKLILHERPVQTHDLINAALFYAADEDATEDARTSAIARAEGALVNIVDNLQDSQFITPAIVDRDPVTVAIGTEGAAPVLARVIKADLEERLPTNLGPLARIGKTFRKMAERLPMGRVRRDFWAEYYAKTGPYAMEQGGEDAVHDALHTLLKQHETTPTHTGHVAFVGAGPGDPDLLTLKARKALDTADVVIHDRLVSPEILELARREATIINAGKEGFGPSMAQDEINTLIVWHAAQGAQVVRLKGGDPSMFGRLDEEIEALQAAQITWHVVPGITAASASAAAIGQSLTRRGRNSTLQFITGHDIEGYADHDWRTLAQPGEVAAIYMGKRSARFLQGRLFMHGAEGNTPVSIVANASTPQQVIIASTLDALPIDLSVAGLNGPALILYGLSPRAAQTALTIPQEQELA